MPGSLVIRCSLGIIGFPKCPRFMEVGNQTQSGAVSLLRLRSLNHCKAIYLRTDVANEPVLHTVNTLSSFPLPPLCLICSMSQSPPHFDISLFRPTSSSAINVPSATRSRAMDRASFPASSDACSVFVKRRVAAPRLTAVGRAVKRNDNIGST